MSYSDQFRDYAEASTGEPTPGEKFRYYAEHVPVIPGRVTPQTAPPVWPPYGVAATPTPMLSNETYLAAQHGWPVATEDSAAPAPHRSAAGQIAIVVGAFLVFMVCLGVAVASFTGAPIFADGSRAASISSPSTAPTTRSTAGTNTAPSGKPVVPAADPTTVTFKAGASFRVGDFQITLHSKKCGIERVDSDFLDTRAQGAYCRLDLTAKNVTRSPHFYDTATALTAFDGQGRKFNADSEAGIYGNENGAGFFEEINPDNATRALVFFDLPKGTTMSRVEFSPGVFTTADTVTVKF